MDPKVLADMALQLIAGSAVKCDPNNLSAAQGVLSMLNGIKSGKYLVVNAPAAEPEAPKSERK